MIRFYPFLKIPIRKGLLLLVIALSNNSLGLFANSTMDTIKIQDGQTEILYSSPNITVFTESKFIMNIDSSIKALLPSSAFNEILIMLISSQKVYTISNEIPNYNGSIISALSFMGYAEGGGVIKAGLAFEPQYISHELFHAYQYDKRGLRPNCICYEVDAYIFQDIALLEAGIYTSKINTELPQEQKYDEAIESLLFIGFDQSSYQQALVYFKYSGRNYLNRYGDIPTCSGSYYEKPLIARFLPLHN